MSEVLSIDDLTAITRARWAHLSRLLDELVSVVVSKEEGLRMELLKRGLFTVFMDARRYGLDDVIDEMWRQPCLHRLKPVE